MNAKVKSSLCPVLTAGLLALTLSAHPLSASQRLEIVAENGGYVAFSSQHTTRFDGTSVEIAGQEDKNSKGAPTVHFQLLEVRKGGAVLASSLDGDPPVTVTGRRIAYARRTGIVERYDVLETGVEQSFVIERRLPGPGDLLITGSLDGDQELRSPFSDGSGGFVIPLGDGGWRMRYGSTTAIDATGVKRAASVAIVDGRITISVDGTWLARAVYPVVVDPLIRVESNWHFQGRPAAAFDFGGSPSYPGATAPCYLVAYESDNSGGPKQIWGKLVGWNGTIIGIPTGDPAFGMSRNISGDSTVAHSRPTVAFKFGSISSPKRNYLVAWERSDHALGYRILDRSGNPLTTPKKISFNGATTLHDVTAAAAPQGGWMASLCGTALGCTPYLLAYRAATLTITGTYSTVRLAVVDDGNGNLWRDVPVESLGSVDDPIYAPHIAYGHSVKADYYLLAYRLSSGAVVVRKVDKMGGIGPANIVTSSSSGPPIVAYSYANNLWSVFWRTTVSNRFGTSVVIQGQMFDGNASWDAFVPVGSRVTAVSEALPQFFETKDLLPEYWVAGSQTATEYPPYQGLFEVAYVDSTRTGEVYSAKVYAGGSLGSTTRLTNDAQADRYVKLAVARIDPLTTGFAAPLACSGAPGSRCALWIFEHSFSSTDHDIYGYVTSSEY